MLSTSILYCNKLDDALLESIDSSALSNSSKSRLSDATRKSIHTPLSTSAISTRSERVTSDLKNPSKARFRVRYLGCNTCDPRTHRLDHGIAAYQKPLLDLYSTVLRRSVVLRSLYSSLAAINQVADLSAHGIVIAERDRFSTSGKNAHLPSQQPSRHSSGSSTSKTESAETVVTKVITPLSNILLWAAVKFQHRSNVNKSKGSSGKRRQIGVAFVPLSCSEAVLDKNAFVSLHSKQRFLLGLPHPPLFACVLQKVNSGQRLECHLFVCLSADDAIRMCSSMADLRHRTANIGKLHVPLSGQMGSYAYKSTPLQSSAASMVSNRSSSYAFSELSSFIGKHHFSPNSDIEEEDASRVVDDLLDSLNSNATSAAKSIAIHGKQMTPRVVSGKLASEHRLPERARKTAVGPMKHLSPVGADSVSWTELSSISSARISTISEPNNSRLGAQTAAAQRDYRFQAYKCPQNFVLPELTKEGEDRVKTCDTSLVSSKKSGAEIVIVEKSDSRSSPQRNKWSNVSDELQSNRLFAKASAIASRELRETNTAPSSAQDSHYEARENVKPNGALSNSLETKVNSRQRFFGDTIRVIKAISKPGHQLPGSRSQLARKAPVASLKLNSTEFKNSRAEASASVSQSIEKICPEGTPRVKSWHRPSNLQSTISNSIFFDEDDSLQSQGNHQVHSENATQISEEYRINAVNKGKFKSNENHIDLPSFHVQGKPTSKSDVPAVVLYLPASSNVGVKGFNKSTPVDKWSTMIASNVSNNSRESDCELCSFELNCEECCNVCQSIEEQQRQSCPDCMLDSDDIVLDESTLQNFTNNQAISSDEAKDTESLLLRQNGNSYRYEIQMASMPRLEAKISKSQSRKPSLFGRIRQLGSSIFGSRKTVNRSRIWSRLRAGSQRLKGSKRFASQPTTPSSAKEPVNRIFLPAPNQTTANGECRVYSEHYLKPPTLEKAPRKRSKERIPGQAQSEALELSETMSRVKLNKRGKEQTKDRQLRNAMPPPVKTSQKTGRELKFQAPNRSHIDKRAEFIKPFFISHPSIPPKGLKISNSEFNPGQVLSLSSDSGMEEYDCQSSAENSPVSYQGMNGAHQKNGNRSKILLHAANGIRHPRKPHDHHHPLHSQACQCDRCSQQQRMMPTFSLCQAGHWSDTNLQGELGYMP